MNTKQKPNNLENSKNPIRMNSILFGMFIIFIVNGFVRFLLLDQGNQVFHWVLTDWLIDFSAGFVRRGLSGEVVNLLLGISRPENTVAIIIWVIFLVVIVGYLRLVYRSKKLLKPLTTFGILFLPCLLPFYLYDHDAFGRKEVLGLILLLYHLLSLESLNLSNYNREGLTKRYLKRLLPISLLLLPALIFIHESTFFLYLPIHGIITFAVLRYDPSTNTRKRFFYLITVYSPVLLSFLIVYFFGSPSIAQARSICYKWEYLNVFDTNYCHDMTGSIGSLAIPLSNGVRRFVNLTGSMALVWFLDILILGFSTAFLGGQVIRDTQIKAIPEGSDDNSVSRTSNTILIKYFLLPLILSLPLYVTAIDYGRWFAVTCINFIMVTLSPEIIRLEIDTEKWIGTVTKNIRVISIILSGAAFLVFLAVVLNDYDMEGIQTLALLFSIVFLFIGILGDKLNMLIQKITDLDNKVYFGVLVFILFVVYFVRIPHMCYDEVMMISQPYRSLIRNLLK